MERSRRGRFAAAFFMCRATGPTLASKLGLPHAFHSKEPVMVKLALYVHMEVAPGKEEELETFLKDGLALVGEEPGTRTWYAIRTGPGTYGIFDTFSDES